MIALLSGLLLPLGPAFADYRSPQNRTVYDDWIADSRYKQDAEKRAKEWERRSTLSGYKDYSADLAALNQQSRMKAQWDAEEAQMKARREARDAARRAREAELAALTRLSDAARDGYPDALMDMGRRNENSEFARWGLSEYQMVFGPRRPEALWRVVDLLRRHADKSHLLNSFRPVDSFLAELATLGDVKAAKELALLREQQGDYDQAGRYFAQAGEGGDRDARRAAIALVAEDRVDAVPAAPENFNAWCESAAGAGIITAQWIHGRALVRGEEVAKNPAKGLALLRQAAGQDPARLNPAQKINRAQAAELAGRMLRDGAGVPADAAAGIALLKLSADAGHIPAMLQLGKTHMLGLGVPADAAKAKPWLEKAAQNDEAQAAYLLAMLELRPGAPAAEQAEGLGWLRRAAKRRPEAMLRYGEFLFEGAYGLEPDGEEAMNYFRLALQRYPRDGQVLDFVGASYLTGNYGARQNSAEAVRMLTLAYEQGSLRSAQRLADAYRTGAGVKADPAEAQRWQSRLQ